MAGPTRSRRLAENVVNWFRDHAPPPSDPWPHRVPLEELKELLQVASDDLTHIGTIAEKTSDQWAIRAFIRATFALIEGVTFAMKQMALAQHTWFTHAELAILREEAPHLDQKGAAAVGPMHLKLSRNVKFAFMALARSLKGRDALDTQSGGWRNFKEAIEVRNRLMHPRGAADLQVSFKEMEMANRAFAWFNALFAECYVAHIRQTALDQGTPLSEDEDQRLRTLEAANKKWLE